MMMVVAVHGSTVYVFIFVGCILNFIESPFHRLCGFKFVFAVHCTIGIHRRVNFHE